MIFTREKLDSTIFGHILELRFSMVNVPVINQTTCPLLQGGWLRESQPYSIREFLKALATKHTITL